MDVFKPDPPPRQPLFGPQGLIASLSKRVGKMASGASEQLFRVFRPDWDKQEAFLCILVAAMMADGKRDREEDDEIAALAYRLNVLFGGKDYDRPKVTRLIEEQVGKIVDAEGKLKMDVVKGAAKSLEGTGLEECVVVNAIEIAYADRIVRAEETVFLGELCQVLGVGANRAEVMLDIIKVKNNRA